MQNTNMNANTNMNIYHIIGTAVVYIGF